LFKLIEIYVRVIHYQKSACILTKVLPCEPRCQEEKPSRVNISGPSCSTQTKFKCLTTVTNVASDNCGGLLAPLQHSHKRWVAAFPAGFRHFRIPSKDAVDDDQANNITIMKPTT
jgi:hypothetical protein